MSRKGRSVENQIESLERAAAQTLKWQPCLGLFTAVDIVLFPSYVLPASSKLSSTSRMIGSINKAHAAARFG